MAFYELYKPFRNYIRQFDLVESLVDIWSYSLNVIDKKPLPNGYAVGLNSRLQKVNDFIFPWDLEILTREIILNARNGGNLNLKWWINMARAMNHIRRLEDAVSADVDGKSLDVIFELHRIAHRQFPWQVGGGMAPMMRAFKIFGESAVEEIVVREMGMTTQQFMLLGIAVSGSFLTKPMMSINQDYRTLGIPKDASAAFFRRFTRTIDEIRSETAETQRYDQDWLYTWNPLELTPLISFDTAFPERIICPLPRYMLRRASSGIYYDLVKSTNFDNPFGGSFQNYVGEVISKACLPPLFTAIPEAQYTVGKNKKHGVDWILSDNTGHLFIECKTIVIFYSKLNMLC